MPIRMVFPDIIERTEFLRSEGLYAEADLQEELVLASYLRITHAERGMNFIRSQYNGHLFYENYPFAEDLAKVCFGHTSDPYVLNDLKCWTLVRSPNEYVNWRFIAIILRLSDILDCDSNRTPRILFRHLGVRSSVSISEWQKHLSICAVGIQPGNITVTARCPNPYTHHDVLGHAAEIEKELKAAANLLADMHHSQKSDMSSHYQLNLPSNVNVENVEPGRDQKGIPIYMYHNISFQLEDERIMELIMGVNLYADRYLFLRELMQNAVDSCRYRTAIYLKNKCLGDYVPHVTIRLIRRCEGEYIEVGDNGMGMSQEVVCDYFAKVGRSYYRSKQFLKDRRNQGFDFQPISQFGIGVLSVFMVSDRLEVETKAVDNSEGPISITIDDAAKLFWFKNGNRTEPGTTMRLKLRISSSEFLEKEALKPKKLYEKEHRPTLLDTVKLVVPHLEFPLEVEEDGMTNDFIGKWMLPDQDHSYANFVETIHLDFTKDGPQGLDGIACVFILKEGCAFESPCYKERIEFEDDEDADYIGHSRGTIEISQTRFNRRGDEIDSSSTYATSSKGRWSQQGFCVPYPLIRDYSNWSFRHSQQAPMIDFPFPVHYDLNLHSSFVLPLSADRKNILPLSQATDVCGRLTRVIAELLLKAMGNNTIVANKDFFVHFLASDLKSGSVFKELLSHYFDIDQEMRQLDEERARWSDGMGSILDEFISQKPD
jgi:molecular chaperone HtpG